MYQNAYLNFSAIFSIHISSLVVVTVKSETPGFCNKNIGVWPGSIEIKHYNTIDGVKCNKLMT